MAYYMIWNKHTNQIVPTTFDNQKKAEETLKAMLPDLKSLDSKISEGDFEITLQDLVDWQIISCNPTGISGVQVSGIRESPAWEEYAEW